MTTPSGSESLLLDSSGWLEYLTADSKMHLFAPYLEGNFSVLVPVIVLYEVPKILLLRQSKTLVDLFVSEVLRRIIIPLDEQLAFLAAELTIAHQLSMADALIYATAQAHRALLITSDTHFANLPGVKLI